MLWIPLITCLGSHTSSHTCDRVHDPGDIWGDNETYTDASGEVHSRDEVVYGHPTGLAYSSFSCVVTIILTLHWFMVRTTNSSNIE